MVLKLYIIEILALVFVIIYTKGQDTLLYYFQDGGGGGLNAIILVDNGPCDPDSPECCGVGEDKTDISVGEGDDMNL